MAKSSAPGRLWWESLSDEVECAITLEPINTLPYPPFVLRKPTNAEDDVLYYFDGRALASYIVSRGIFQNPLTRDPLTWDDCRRLDEYVEMYGTESFQVLEAFALRESVQVRTPQYTGNNNAALDESRRRRADYLRSEATAALTGLFDYNSNRRQQKQAKNDRRRPTPSTRHNAQPPVPPRNFGFNLHANHPKQSKNDDNDGYGMVVIDDDDAVREESEQVEFRQLQEAFPRLSTQTSQDPPIHHFSGDDRVVQQIKHQAEQDRLQALVRQQALEWAKHQLEQEARQRKEELQKKKSAAKQQAEEIYRQKQQEQEEMERARAEIEAWREGHWKRLREMADQKEEQERLKREQQQREQQQQQKLIEKSSKDGEDNKIDEENEEAFKLAKEKAAKAAKRKRAKDKKKAQKEQERKEQEEEARQAALQAEKEASKSKCAACKGGILGLGFEKFDHQFCSTKCARAGPSS